MTIGPWLRPPRRLLFGFLATTCLLAAGLGWLGWQVVDLDRRLERTRTQERLDRALDMVVRSLGSWLLDVDRDLTTLVSRADSPELPTSPLVTELPRDASWVVVGPSFVRVFPEASLAFYPEAISKSASTTVVTAPTGTGNPAAAEAGEQALVTLANAAALRKQGQHDRALALYAPLSKSQVLVPGLDAPADIVALHARCLVLASLGRTEALGREARALVEAVTNPARQLTRRIYSYYSTEAIRWIGSESAEGHTNPKGTSPLARAVVVGELVDRWQGRWQERWRERSTTAELPSPARVEYTTSGPFVAASMSTGQALAMVVVPATVIQARIDEVLASTPGIALSIADVDGAVILGSVVDATTRVMRSPAETRLPWTLTAAPGPGWVPDATASERQRLVMIGVLLVGTAVLGGAWITGRAMNRELEAARLQTEFVAAVSHEFRTPLAAFGQLTELLVDGRVATEADRLVYYGRLQHETRRLERLVDDLLDFRRMEAGSHEFEFSDVDLVSLTRGVVTDCQSTGSTTQPRLDLSSSAPAITVRADPEAISRAVRNLVENALKYAPGTPSVRVRVEADAETASVAVSDTGPGIPPELQQAVFEKFVRAGAASAGIRGTGLGLAMVRHIVRAHGGTVRVNSTVDKGSTFTLSIPLPPSAQAAHGGV